MLPPLAATYAFRPVFVEWTRIRCRFGCPLRLSVIDPIDCQDRPGNRRRIEAMTDGLARDAALVHSDVLRERGCARWARAAANRAGLPLDLHLGLSVASAQALLSAAASGMMALTGIVFAMAFVMVQFSAIAYSPRLVLWFTRDRMLFHALGAFTATFVYALFTLAWVDRGGSAKVPLFSTLLVGIMIIVSMLMFARLMQRLGDLQIGNVLHLVGDQGRAVIGEMFRRLDESAAASRAPEARRTARGSAASTQTVKYFGKPRTIARFDVDSLVALARQAGGTIVMACAVGDTLVEGDVLLRVHDAANAAAGRGTPARRSSREANGPSSRTRNIRSGFSSTSPSRRCRRRSTTRRRRSRRSTSSRTSCAASAQPSSTPAMSPTKNGALRLVFPTPTWEDYLTLAFDEIRQFGASSVQVMRRMRSALVGLAESLPSQERAEAVRRYLEHLDRVDRSLAVRRRRPAHGAPGRPAGIGLSRRPVDT